MATRRTPAFILRTVDYGDHHLIVHLLGRHTGRLSAIAYGARSSKRRFSGALEPLRVVDATIRPPKSGDLYRLQELDVTEDFPGLEERIETITAAGYGTELTRETWREGEDATAVFALLHRFYSHLPNCPSSVAVARLVHQFEYQLLDLYGLAPAIEHCARCSTPPAGMDKLRCSRRGEGLVCRMCRRPDEAIGVITPATLDMLRHLADPDHPLPTDGLEAAVAQAGRVLHNAIIHLVERPLVSRQMLFDLL